MADPQWPAWVEKLKSHYLAGSSSFFILHGNVDDVVGSTAAGPYAVETLADFLARRMFGRYDLVLHYDLGRGLRPHPGGDPKRLNEMNALAERLISSPAELPRDPTKVLRALDRLIALLLVGGERTPRKTAFLFDYSEWLCPPGGRFAEHVATFLNWARSPVVKRVNMIFILMAQSLGQLHPSLVQSGFTTEVRVAMPDLPARRDFVQHRFPDLETDADRLARLSAGLTLSNLENLLRLVSRIERQTSAPAKQIMAESAEAEDPPTESKEIAEVEVTVPTFMANYLETKEEGVRAPTPEKTPPISTSDAFLTQIKKQLIEAQCPGLIEFIEPRLSLDLVAGHTAAKQRLRDDARLIGQGELEAVPMGYLICGPVGVGKTFLALCYAGTVGIPCVEIKNFRSKYVGETEANLEKILGVLRELGPVAVIIDEADAAVGNRGASGDSGTSARVFARLASQMGNTKYRGQVIWFLLTCRPDLLPIDLKRQGRCEEHIPLFYPATADERRDMFLAMSKKMNLDLKADALPDLTEMPALSGADIEGVLTRVRRDAILQAQPITAELIGAALKEFRSPRGPEHELQWLAGILECSDLRYLPDKVRNVVEMEGGFDTLAKRFRELSDTLA